MFKKKWLAALSDKHETSFKPSYTVLLRILRRKVGLNSVDMIKFSMLFLDKIIIKQRKSTCTWIFLWFWGRPPVEALIEKVWTSCHSSLGSMVDLYVGTWSQMKLKSIDVCCRFPGSWVSTCSYPERIRLMSVWRFEPIPHNEQVYINYQAGISHKLWTCFLLLVLQLGKHIHYWKFSGYRPTNHHRKLFVGMKAPLRVAGLTAANCAKQVSLTRPKPSWQKGPSWPGKILALFIWQPRQLMSLGWLNMCKGKSTPKTMRCFFLGVKGGKCYVLSLSARFSYIQFRMRVRASGVYQILEHH